MLSFCLSSSTILISSANVDTVVASKTSVSSIDISRKYTADNVAQMGDVIDVRERTGNQNVALASLWEGNLFIDASNLSLGVTD